jgi:hypothetical protein
MIALVTRGGSPMKALRCTVGFAGLLLLAALPAVGQDKPGDKISLKPVKYAGLAETIVQNRGKVIVVDLWGFF